VDFVQIRLEERSFPSLGALWMMEMLQQNICVPGERELPHFFDSCSMCYRAAAAHLQPNVFITVFMLGSDRKKNKY